MEVVKSSKLIQSIIHVANWTKNSRIINHVGATFKSSKALNYLFAERHTFERFIENSKILSFNKPMEKQTGNKEAAELNWNSSFSKQNDEMPNQKTSQSKQKATGSNLKSTIAALTNWMKSSYFLTLICTWKDCEEDDQNT